jgi:hypothetical protein
MGARFCTADGDVDHDDLKIDLDAEEMDDFIDGEAMVPVILTPLASVEV